MVSFRKFSLALAALGLMAGTMSAQSNCNVSSDSPVVRAEGITEPVGAITITCNTSIPQGVDSRIYFSVKTDNPAITNKLTDTTNNILGGADAPVLKVNYLNGFTPLAATAKLKSATEIGFDNVLVSFPGTATQLVVRIENVRVNANTAGAGNTVKAVVTAFSASEGSQSLTYLVSNATTTVAQVQTGLTFTAIPLNGTNQVCTGLALPAGTNAGPFVGTGSNSQNAVLKFQPGFALAFKNLVGEGVGADTGTQLIARFKQVPSNAKLWVSTGNIGTGYTVGLSAADSSATGDTATTAAGTDANGKAHAEVTWRQIKADTNGNYFAVWNVTNFSASNLSDPVLIAVALTYDGGKPGANVLQVNGNFAPISDKTAADKDAKFPRFVDSGATYTNIISVAPCSTTLLFPYVTSVAPWETGIVINNTASDLQLADGTYLFTGGTKAMSAQNGTCTLNFFPAASGTTAPTAQTTSSIAAGNSEVILLSSGGVGDTAVKGVPNFYGYVIAQCGFQYAHGFAFMTSGSANQGGVGYAALVIPPASSGSRLAGGSTSESLGQ